MEFLPEIMVNDSDQIETPVPVRYYPTPNKQKTLCNYCGSVP